MRLEDETESENVEDQRGAGGRGRRGAGIGCVGLLVVLGVSLLTGVDPRRLLGLLGAVQEMAPSAPQGQAGQPPADDPQTRFVRKVLRTTETTWAGLFERSGRRYVEPTLVLFDGEVESACGFSSAAVGPFYCPGDRKVYLDLSFFRELSRRFGAPGDFAQAYVIAHEIGHHVQNLRGISARVQALQQRARTEEEANGYSVRLELQADCFAGVWGRSQEQILDPGDVEEGLRAAAAIGDDVLQRRAEGHVVPESWTHGSSAMRVRWLKRGIETGDPEACDTFK